MRNAVREEDLTLPSEVWRKAVLVYTDAALRGCEVGFFCKHLRLHLLPKGAVWDIGRECLSARFRNGPARLRLYDLDVLARLVSTAVNCGVRTPEVKELAYFLFAHGDHLAPDKDGVLALKVVRMEVTL